jgi:DNA-binding NarL/FixJ family response regulator
MKPKIIIADDHKLFNNGLKEILYNEFDIIAQIFDGKEVIPAVVRLLPSLILLDINLPNIKGLEIAQELKKSFEHIKVVFMTMYKEEAFVKAAKALDADGYILKESDSEFLIASLQLILAGKKVYDFKLDDQKLNLHHDDFFVKEYALSKREVEIIRYLKNGYSNNEIAEKINLSFETIKSHRKNIYLKLGLGKLPELIRFAQDKGL